MKQKERYITLLTVVLLCACGPSGGAQSVNAQAPKPDVSSTKSDGDQISIEDQKLAEVNVPFSMLGGGPRHLHRADVPGPKTTPNEVAHFRCGARIFASPVIGPDGTVYVGSIDGTFNAIRFDGSLRWSYVCSGPIFSTAAVSRMGTVYVGCDDDMLLAFSTDGTSRFNYKMKHDVDSAPVIGSGGSIYVGGDGLHILGPNGKRRAKVWLGGHVSASPSVRPDGTVVVGSHDHRLYAVYPDGTVAWSFDTKGPVESPAAVFDNNDIVFGSNDGYVYRLSSLGIIRWKFKTDGPVRGGIAVTRDEKSLYAASMDGSVYALDASSGKEIFKVETASAIRSSPMLDSEGTLYVGSRDHHLYAIDGSLGEVLWRLDLQSEIDSTVAVASERRLIVGSDDGVIRILKEVQ